MGLSVDIADLQDPAKDENPKRDKPITIRLQRLPICAK
jgi:hypothetical protein